MLHLAHQAVELDAQDVKAKMNLGCTLVELGKKGDGIEQIEQGVAFLIEALQLAKQPGAVQDVQYIESVLEPKIEMAKKISYLKEFEIQEEQK